MHASHGHDARREEQQHALKVEVIAGFVVLSSSKHNTADRAVLLDLPKHIGHHQRTQSDTMGSVGQDKYIRWDAKGVEFEQEGELDKIWEVSKQFNRLQMMNFNEHMHCLRGTHLKTQGCVIGKLKVHEHLPAHLAQGMFAKGGTYDCIMRYSSLTPKIVPDNIPAPRGIGLKVFGVEGEKIWGEDKKTQDFTFNNYPILELRTPVATCEIADSLERNWNTLDKFGEELSQRPDAEVATLPARLDRQHSKL